MKYYFISVTTVKPKNRANERLQEHVMHYHHKVVDEENLEEIIYLIRVTTSSVNETFGRCQNIQLYLQRNDDLNQVGLYVDSNFNFSANLVTGFRIAEPIPVL